MIIREKNLLQDRAVRQAVKIIADAIDNRRYGKVQINFQNGKIVYFEKSYTEKVEESGK